MYLMILFLLLHVICSTAFIIVQYYGIIIVVLNYSIIALYSVLLKKRLHRFWKTIVMNLQI